MPLTLGQFANRKAHPWEFVPEPVAFATPCGADELVRFAQVVDYQVCRLASAGIPVA